jgi:NitT/TauT family transport system ATP-binding protein
MSNKSSTSDSISAAVDEAVGVAHVLEAVREKVDAPRPPVVEFRNVTKTYNAGQPNAFTAIQDVNFVVADLAGKGEFVCILGPSGCGKSTILRLIAGLEPQHPATKGDVLVFGKPVIGPAADRGMVFQDYTSFDHRSVEGNIAFGLECQGVSRAERNELAQYWIEQVGLNVATDAEKCPHELSGGMRQRVAIARTLILHPRIILMDEPFGALDPQTRMNMQDLLIKLWRKVEATVFFITHSIEEAVFLGDRVYIMTTGPGRIMKELEIEPADRPALEMARVPRFQETVYYIRDLIAKLEAEGKSKSK